MKSSHMLLCAALLLVGVVLFASRAPGPDHEDTT